MNRFHRFCSRHRWAPPVMALVCIGFCRLVAPSVDDVVFWMLCGALFMLSLVCGSSSTYVLQNTAIRIMNDQCDPFPLLEETNRQLLYVKNRSNRQLLSLNRCAALIEAGDFEWAVTELEKINIDDPTPPSIGRYVYYHNLTCATLACGQMEKAEVYYHEATRLYDDLRGKTQEKMRPLYVSLIADRHLCYGEYPQAYDLLAPMQPTTQLSRMHRTYSLGRIALAQGDTATARTHLEYVMQNGGRTHLVHDAQKMLEEMV